MDREKTSVMEIDTVLEAFKDFEEKGKTEVCPVLEQFLCRVAKTGETMVQWSQFKSYFLFKLEKVIDDFRASAPEQRGTTVSNVDSIPFEEMKERILKIVNGYNGIPFTIQRLCELLMEPKRNYTGTDKFLRGVEKNVMVVSCVYPTSDKNGNVNRMNGFLFPGNPLAFSDRNVNGPGTPRPPSRPKLSLSGSLATNGHPDFTASPERVAGHGDRTLSDSSPLEGGFLGNPVKNKHQDDGDDDGGEGPTQAEQQEVKRLKFDQDQDHDEDAPRGEQQEVKRLKFDHDHDHDATQAEESEGKFDQDEEEDKEKESACPVPAESLSGVAEEEASDVPGVKEEEYKSRGDSESASSPACVNQEPSSTEREPLLPDHKGEKAEPESSERLEGVSEMGQSGLQAPPTRVVLQEVSEGSEAHELVSGSVETGTSEASNQPVSPEPTAQTGNEPMEQN